MSRLKLNERDYQILKLLVNSCFQIGLNVDQLVSYFTAMKNEEVNLQSLESGLRRRLGQLTEHGLLETKRYIGEEQMCYCATADGLSVFHEKSDVIYKLKEKQRDEGYARHARMTAGFMLCVTMGLLRDQSVSDFATIQDKLELQSGRYILPDGILGACKDNENYLFYAEIDRTTEPLSFFREKMESYLEHFARQEEDLSPETILIVSPTLSRTENLLKTTREAIPKRSGALQRKKFLFSYTDLLQREILSRGWLDASQSPPLSPEHFTKGIFYGRT